MCKQFLLFLELTDSTKDLSSESSYSPHSLDFDDNCSEDKSTCNDDDGRLIISKRHKIQ